MLRVACQGALEIYTTMVPFWLTFKKKKMEEEAEVKNALGTFVEKKAPTRALTNAQILY